MAKRKKHPRLPNGYGQIRFLGKNRRNPYGVYPPAKEEYENGQMKPQKAICYVSDWMIGFAVLTAYKAGTYTPGMEKDIQVDDKKNAEDFIQSLLANYNQVKGIKAKEEPQLTFAEVFRKFNVKKFGHEYDAKKVKRTSLEYTLRAGFKNSSALHNRIFSELVTDDLQEVMDACPLSHASIEHIQNLYYHMYKYAMANNLCTKDYSSYVEITQDDDDEHGIPFTDEDLKKLWETKENEVSEMILIMCYSGFRISEYKNLEVHLKERYFFGGIKTDAGKNRTVPIYSGILNLVKHRIKVHGSILPDRIDIFRDKMYAQLSALGIEKHTPHDCRHTFSKLCEKYKVMENDRKRMLGHKIGDITNDTYGHRTLEDLRNEIEKIEIDLL